MSSADIAYSRIPAASRASASVSNVCHQVSLPSRHRAAMKNSRSKGCAAAHALTAKTSAQERHLPTLSHLIDLGPDIREDRERFLPPRADTVMASIRGAALHRNLVRRELNP